MLSPKGTKFKKMFKGKIKGTEHKSTHLKFGNFGLKSLEIGRISAIQIESARRVIARKLKRMGKIHIRIFPDIPITTKPKEVRMGKGKGAVDFWGCRVKSGQILYEIEGVSQARAMGALTSASHKLPILTNIVNNVNRF